MTTERLRAGSSGLSLSWLYFEHMRAVDIIIKKRNGDALTREDLLDAVGLRAPPVVQLSNRLHAGALTVPELVAALQED